eukprot:GGOE01036494.1.p1 GENE.GGOE01036494.1~~GGOE01036494.1.p1  ORF type:complete len:297 (+),score=68.30 GGOE01036494.1:94-891(+)
MAGWGAGLLLTVAVVGLSLFLLLPQQQRCESCPSCPTSTAVRLHRLDVGAAVISDSSPKPLPPLRTREELADLCQAENFTVGLEIGVYRGLFAEQVLERWPKATTYYCLDAWKHQDNYNDIANKPQRQFDDLLAQTKTRLAKWEGKVRYVRAFSNEAVSRFPDESIDFIYVDARHDYKGVAEDVRLYWPKLRRGGVLAGHDFLDQADLERPERMKKGKQRWDINGDGTSSHGKAVRSAVLEFSVAVNRQVVVTYEDLWPSWYFRK